MTTVTEVVASSSERPVIICDVSPPRGGPPGSFADAAGIDADFLSVAYSPGQSVRVSSPTAAAYLQDRLGKQAVFTLATRDMNRIALQSLLLGAGWQGLQNVVILRGDPLQERDHGVVSSINDYSTTALLADIASMNQGLDFRGLALAGPTSLCAGATVDLSKGLEDETALAGRKVNSGAEFLLAQAHFEVSDIAKLRDSVSQKNDRHVPVFAGVQLLKTDGIDFGNVPDRIRQEIGAGKSGMDVAKELALALWAHGISTFYVIPTILRGGVRDYEAAIELIRYIRTLPPSLPT